MAARGLARSSCCCIYVIVSVGGQAFHGPRSSTDNPDDVFAALGERRARLAAGQAADHRRADLGVGLDPDHDPADGPHRAVDGGARRHPEAFAQDPPPVPDASDVDGLGWARISIVWYVGLTLVSENILIDSIAALGLMIAFYYGADRVRLRPIYYRHELGKSVNNFLFIAVAPLVGAAIFTWAFFASPSISIHERGGTWLGVGGGVHHRDRLPGAWGRPDVRLPAHRA